MSTWNGTTGDWTDPNRWDSLDFPNNGNGGFSYDATVGGGAVTLEQNITIEKLILSGGMLTVESTNIDTTLTANIGIANQGMLSILAGAKVNSTLGTVAAVIDSTGTTTVSGADSTWHSDELSVGESGAGSLIVEAGGLVESTTGYVGYFAGSVGTVTLTGGDSNWTNTEILYVGFSGDDSSVLVEAGATVMSESTNIAHWPGSQAIVTVTGTDSSWTNVEWMLVGWQGHGALNVEAGGTVTNKVGVLGHTGYEIMGGEVIGTGVTTVTGIGSTWTSTEELYVGFNGGSGELNIENEGIVSSEYGYLALNSGSGEATVSGTGSQWNITTNLNVGGAGHATLDIEAGGTVTTGFSGTIGDASPAVGMVNVSGATSTLNLGSNLIVGRSGSGTLVIEDGGSVESQTGFLGQFAGSQGNVTITGAGSLWTTTGDLYLGGDDTAAGGTGLLSLLNEGQVDVGGALYVHNTGTIHGAGTVIGEVVSSGRVAPGNSPGILTITGDYTQTASSVLEIEVQGYTAGTEHDQLQVSGTATLAGRLEVPILQPFDPNDGPYPPPTPGQSIQFLTAGTRTGEFSAVVSPNLQTLYPGLAIDVAYESGGARLSFAPIKTTVVFDEDSSSTANWFDPNDTWEDTASPGDPVIPTLLHDISIQNLTISAQEVEVVTSNAFVAKLSVGGGSNDLVVKIGGGAFSETMGNLSSTLGVTVVSKGVVAMNGGTLATSTMTLDGGNLIGNGLVGLSSNTSVGTGTLTVSSGIISPGFSVGHLEVDGNYLQTSSGQLSLEVDDPNSFDTLAITGDASLGGTLVVTIDDIADAPPGTVINVLTAGSITNTFENVVLTGEDDIYLIPVYGSNFVALATYAEGDMNPFIPGIGEEDAVAFALALIDPVAYRNTYGISADEAGDIDDIGNNGLDFDDIDDFVRILNQAIGGSMTMAQMFDIIEAVQLQVPEPASASLMILAFLSVTGSYRRMRIYRC